MVYPNLQSQKPRKDESSREKLAYILGRPHMAQPNGGSHKIDKYISLEKNEDDQSQGHRMDVHLPSYRKQDEVSYIRIINEGTRAQSSKRLPSAKIPKREYRDYSVQPRYNENARYLLENDVKRQKASLSVDPVNRHVAYPRPNHREIIRNPAQILQRHKVTPNVSIDRKVIDRHAHVSKHPNIYSRVRPDIYKYHQPDWWG